MRLFRISSNFYRLNTPNGVMVWFSYEIPIALRNGDRFFISINEWGLSTGKHLNFIDPFKPIRIPHSELSRELILCQY